MLGLLRREHTRHVLAFEILLDCAYMVIQELGVEVVLAQWCLLLSDLFLVENLVGNNGYWERHALSKLVTSTGSFKLVIFERHAEA